MFLNTTGKDNTFSLSKSFYIPKSRKSTKNPFKSHSRTSSLINFYPINKTGSTRFASNEESTTLVPRVQEVYSSLGAKEKGKIVLKASRRLELGKQRDSYSLVKKGYNSQFQITNMTQFVKENEIDKFSKNRKQKRKLSILLNQVQVAQRIQKMEQTWKVKEHNSKSMNLLKSRNFQKIGNNNKSFSKNHKISIKEQQIDHQIRHIQKRRQILKLPNSGATIVKASNNRRKTIDQKSILGFVPGSTFLDLNFKKTKIERDNITIKPGFLNRKLYCMKEDKQVRDFAFEIGEVKNHRY